MPDIIYTKGLPASGKTTWAKEQIKKNPKFKRVNKDDLRSLLDNSVYTDANEKFIIKMRDTIITESLNDGFTIICDDTNLAPKHAKRFEDLANIYKKASGNECNVILKDFTDVSVGECLKRDKLRPNSVGEKVILNMYNQFLKKEPIKYSPPDTDYTLDDVVICDLDGTLALLNGRDPYDASTCENDKLNEPVHMVLCSLYATNKAKKIIFLSGREDKYREQTTRFLNKHGLIHRYELYMRKTGDNRKDSIIKKEIFYAHIHGRYNPILWLDDRQQVVDMVRHELGIPLFQVAEGYF